MWKPPEVFHECILTHKSTTEQSPNGDSRINKNSALFPFFFIAKLNYRYLLGVNEKKKPVIFISFCIIVHIPLSADFFINKKEYVI